MEAENGFEPQHISSCINQNGKKLYLIRYPKDLDLKILEKAVLNLNQPIVGEIDVANNGIVLERLIIKKDENVSSAIRPIVLKGEVKKDKKKSSAILKLDAANESNLIIGNSFTDSIVVSKQSKIIDSGLDTVKNIQPSYQRIPQLKELVVNSLPFGSTSTLESVRSKASGVNNTKAKADAPVLSNKRKHSIVEEEVVEVEVSDKPKKKKSKKESK